MVLSMARPTSRRKLITSYSSASVFQQTVLQLARNQKPRITLPAEVPGEPDLTVRVKLGDAVWPSRFERRPGSGPSAQTSAALQLRRFYDVLRNGPRPLTHIRIVELAGIAYRQMVAE